MNAAGAAVCRGHTPVLLNEAVEALVQREDGIYLDCTFGRGGHSAAILGRLGPGGRLVAMDRDPEAESAASARFSGDPRFTFERCSFAMLGSVTKRLGIAGRVDGVLMDLGVSSPQLDAPERGFSFMREGPLDMRMDPTSGLSAATWINGASETEIATVLRDYGEERHARRIARAIVESRPHTTTTGLAAVIAAAQPSREPGQHPATRSFQAIRIFINHELGELEAALPQAVAALAPGGRLAVISFHSLEDRIVKRFMRAGAEGERLPRGLPVRGDRPGRVLRLVGRAVRAGKAESAANPRARSAVLRVAERLV